jgi:hypothetical protein
MVSTTAATEANETDGECEDDGDIGAMSQAVMDICERVEVHQDDNGSLAEIPEEIESGLVSSRLCRMPVTETTDLSQEQQVATGIHAGLVADAYLSGSPLAEVRDPATPNGYSPHVVAGKSAAALLESARPNRLVAEGYAAGETQSPMQVAVSLNTQIKEEQHSILGDGEAHPRIHPDSKATIVDLQVPPESLVDHGAPGEAAKRKVSPRNTKVVGTTTDKIRRGEAGQSTFTASDLFLPAGSRKKKRKERPHT